MVIKWREREHEEIDSQFLEDDKVLESLHQCGLNNFFEMSNMKTQKRLLRLLIRYWEPHIDAFMIDGQSLNIEDEKIYFIMGLS
jgi:hypothetical protein